MDGVCLSLSRARWTSRRARDRQGGLSLEEGGPREYGLSLHLGRRGKRAQAGFFRESLSGPLVQSDHLVLKPVGGAEFLSSTLTGQVGRP